MLFRSIMVLMTWMILHPQMALIGHHARVEMRLPTHTHPLKQRIGINTDVGPIVVIGPSPITTGVTMGVIPMTMAVIAPLTHQTHQVIEVGEMTRGHPGTTHTPHECVGVQGRGQCPLIPLHIMSGTMMMTLMKTNMRQNFCIDMTAVPIWSEQPHYKHHSIRLKCEERVTCLLQ